MLKISLIEILNFISFIEILNFSVCKSEIDNGVYPVMVSYPSET